MRRNPIILVIMAILLILATLVTISVLADSYYFNNEEVATEVIEEEPQEVLIKYFSLLQQGNYEALVDLVNIPNSYSVNDFIARNKNIYQGIQAKNIKIEVLSAEKVENTNNATISFRNTMKIKGNDLDFTNTASVTMGIDNHYKINWSSNLIFPELNNEYKVRVSTLKFERGRILDRNGNVLATQGKASHVGVIPGRLGENKNESVSEIARILKMTEESIHKAITASWVKDDSFVPLKIVASDDAELKQELLMTPGVMIDTISIRVYPYKDIASHITGYVQGITLEEFEKMPVDTDYTLDSIIGKTGVEKAFEDRLRGKDGIKIFIEDDTGKVVKTLSEIRQLDGEDITLTIDINLQAKIYDQLKNDEGVFVIMNYKTGEMLSLISTPSYDANKFVMGFTEDEWEIISNDKHYPLYTRFTESWCPGSTFKPLTAGVGLTSGKLTTTDTFYYYGTSWRKNTWTNHTITTLSAYSGRKNLLNALMFSDNIYFAQAALKIGETEFINGLNRIMFRQKIDFELDLAKSNYSNSEGIAGETILADSGYGQGEILVNPIHMASIYSSFLNGGNMMKPYLEYSAEPHPEYLVQGAFSKDAADIIASDLIQAVENPYATGHNVKVKGLIIGGKTGTAELKAPGQIKGDTLGWFDCFVVNDNTPYVIVSMAKNQGSTYLKTIIRTLFT